MTALLWIVFGWLVVGTVYSALRPVKGASETVGSLIATFINISVCIVVAIAAAHW